MGSQLCFNASSALKNYEIQLNFTVYRISKLIFDPTLDDCNVVASWLVISVPLSRIPSGFFETILTRPSLKQIDFRLFDDLHFGCGIEQEFTKNPMVEELTF